MTVNASLVNGGNWTGDRLLVEVSRPRRNARMVKWELAEELARGDVLDITQYLGQTIRLVAVHPEGLFDESADAMVYDPPGSHESGSVEISVNDMCNVHPFGHEDEDEPEGEIHEHTDAVGVYVHTHPLVAGDGAAHSHADRASADDPPDPTPVPTAGGPA